MTKEIETKGRADSIDKLVSKRLKMRRMMLGLSQNDLGKAVDVSIQQVQKYEKATNRISSGKLFAFAKFLKVPINYFYDKVDNTNGIANSVFAEEASVYEANTQDHTSEKEVLTLVKAFTDIKNPQSRKKVIELIKTMT
ncbi:MAG: helix-turn-helix transcriptional regulator [Rickettsiaceae bacterium]|nr:helix-turn-helix transcriptional regulator [Rickettsiaceae bacterium]